MKPQPTVIARQSYYSHEVGSKPTRLPHEALQSGRAWKRAEEARPSCRSAWASKQRAFRSRAQLQVKMACLDLATFLEAPSQEAPSFPTAKAKADRPQLWVYRDGSAVEEDEEEEGVEEGANTDSYRSLIEKLADKHPDSTLDGRRCSLVEQIEARREGDVEWVHPTGEADIRDLFGDMALVVDDPTPKDVIEELTLKLEAAFAEKSFVQTVMKRDRYSRATAASRKLARLRRQAQPKGDLVRYVPDERGKRLAWELALTRATSGKFRNLPRVPSIEPPRGFRPWWFDVPDKRLRRVPYGPAPMEEVKEPFDFENASRKRGRNCLETWVDYLEELPTAKRCHRETIPPTQILRACRTAAPLFRSRRHDLGLRASTRSLRRPCAAGCKACSSRAAPAIVFTPR
ncbi:MAG: hypothetical protein Q9157_001352 [Trypethelium eluteriae]